MSLISKLKSQYQPQQSNELEMILRENSYLKKQVQSLEVRIKKA